MKEYAVRVEATIQATIFVYAESKEEARKSVSTSSLDLGMYIPVIDIEVLGVDEEW